jgi:predicted RNA-binding protein
MANAYLINSSGRELLLEGVAFIRCEGEELCLRPLFGEETCIRGKIREIDFTNSRILLEQEPSKGG